MAKRCYAQRGFNLVEAAIVLGIIGLVIGGIWWAAAKISEQTEANQTLNDMHYALERAVQLLQSRNAGTVSTNDAALELFFPAGYRVTGGTQYVYRPGSKIAWRLSVAGSTNQVTLGFMYDPDVSAASPTSRSAMPTGLCMRVLMEYMATLNDLARNGTGGTFGATTDGGSVILGLSPDVANPYKNWQSSGGQGVTTICGRGLRTLIPTGVYVK